MKLSIVSPVYKAERMVEELVQRILALSIPEISEMELVLVEDGSPDQSWEEIKKVAAKYPQDKGIQLSRNFGQHPAIIPGLKACNEMSGKMVFLLVLLKMLLCYLDWISDE